MIPRVTFIFCEVVEAISRVCASPPPFETRCSAFRGGGVCADIFPINVLIKSTFLSGV